ncbi:MAG: hypothetical protein II184_09465 [Clostridia bacterium]|nr:hypothetical protein [Clostridia bacterium]
MIVTIAPTSTTPAAAMAMILPGLTPEDFLLSSSGAFVGSSSTAAFFSVGAVVGSAAPHLLKK